MIPVWKKPEMNRFIDWLRVFFTGMCMGAADVVPGISGGTIAFIMGIYDDLLHSIASFNPSNVLFLLKGQIQRFISAVSWKFLLALILGMGLSFLSLASFITYCLNDEIYRIYLYSTFLGLVLGSCYYCSKQIRIWHVKLFFFFLVGTTVAFFLSGKIAASEAGRNYDIPIKIGLFSSAIEEQILVKQPVNFDRINRLLLGVNASEIAAMQAKGFLDSTSQVIDRESEKRISVNEVVSFLKKSSVDFYIVLCGAIAVSAMLLPGVSGSYMLTILGMYSVVLGALLDFMSALSLGNFDTFSFRIVSSMLCGIIIGAMIFSRFVSYLLDHYKDFTLATLIGFMVGALRAVWPYWSYSYSINPMRLYEGPKLLVVEPIIPDVTSSYFAISLTLFITGFVLVLIIEAVAGKKRAINTYS